jgi:hypothetical protein
LLQQWTQAPEATFGGLAMLKIHHPRVYDLLSGYIATPCSETCSFHASLSHITGSEKAFVQDFVAAWTKVMNLDRFDLA